MGEKFRSCLAMASAMALGLGYGVFADRNSPVSAGSFLDVAGVSVMLLSVAALKRRAAGGTARRGIGRGLYGGLAGFASLLIVADAFRDVGRETLPVQVVEALPFLLGVGHAARHGAWLAACGAGGFFVTAVAMLYANSGGGWAGFFSVSCS
ncbi:MAG: hypothetical protein U0790_21545 [Isosphaeraceae bacterium]